MLKLTCTADDLKPLASAVDLDPPVHPWNPAERAELQAELDAAFFVLYGIEREDVEYILSTFQGLNAPDEHVPMFAGSDNLILAAFDRLSQQVE